LSGSGGEGHTVRIKRKEGKGHTVRKRGRRRRGTLLEKKRIYKEEHTFKKGEEGKGVAHC
jgi:hypothetical protein